MKKILVASTALSLLGGAALAEVKTTADARMGVQYFKADSANAEGKWDFTSRIRVTFTASGETDGGLAFGGTIRADNASNRVAAGNADWDAEEETTWLLAGAGGNVGSAGNVWVSGAFGKIALGDVDSAAEAANGQLWGVGLDDREWDHIAYVGAGSSSNAPVNGGTQNPVALYSYSFGDGNVFVSLADGNPTESWGLAGNYKFGDFTVGAGYEKTGDVKQVSVSAAAKFGDIAVKAIYAEGENEAATLATAVQNTTQWGLGASYTVDALNVAAFYRVNDTETVAGVEDSQEIYGLGASYDLGGGAKVVGGYANKEGTGEHFSLGIAMTF